MDLIIELLKQDFMALITSAFIVMAGIIAMADIIGKFSVLIGKPVRWIRNKEKDHELLIHTVDEMGQLAKSLSDISQKIDQMQQSTNARFEISEQKHNKRIRAELKDKISQLYRYYHALGQIHDMELEALEDLIEEYEAAQGQNSFVHSVVQKEMYTWTRI